MQNKCYSLYRPVSSTVREAYSMLTGNIYLGSRQKNIKSIVVTSAEPKVGKTSVAISLAITMATWGKKTVLVDADMRKLVENKPGEVGIANGIYQYLKGILRVDDILHPTNVENLMFIPSGRISENPMGLLCSDNLRKLLDDLSGYFDYIVFDTPSLDSVSDAAIISSRVDATYLVAKMGFTKLEAIKRAKEQLEKNNSNLLGVVMNKVGKRDYKRYFSAYKYYPELTSSNLHSAECS